MACGILTGAMRRKDAHLNDADKLALLRKHDICNVGWQSLQDHAFCLHCDQSFTGEQVRVYVEDGELMLECGTPDCDGSPLDWSRKPWWRTNKV